MVCKFQKAKAIFVVLMLVTREAHGIRITQTEDDLDVEEEAQGPISSDFVGKAKEVMAVLLSLSHDTDVHEFMGRIQSTVKAVDIDRVGEEFKGDVPAEVQREIHKTSEEFSLVFKTSFEVVKSMLGRDFEATLQQSKCRLDYFPEAVGEEYGTLKEFLSNPADNQSNDEEQQAALACAWTNVNVTPFSLGKSAFSSFSCIHTLVGGWSHQHKCTLSDGYQRCCCDDGFYRPNMDTDCTACEGSGDVGARVFQLSTQRRINAIVREIFQPDCQFEMRFPFGFATLDVANKARLMLERMLMNLALESQASATSASTEGLGQAAQQAISSMPRSATSLANRTGMLQLHSEIEGWMADLKGGVVEHIQNSSSLLQQKTSNPGFAIVLFFIIYTLVMYPFALFYCVRDWQPEMNGILRFALCLPFSILMAMESAYAPIGWLMDWLAQKPSRNASA